MFVDEFIKAKRNEPFQPFRVIASTGQVFDICYRDHFMVGEQTVILGISDSFQRDVLDRTIKLNHGQIVSIDPLPVPQTRASGSVENGSASSQEDRSKFIEELRKAKRKEPFEPFRVTTASGQLFDICYYGHFLVVDQWVYLGIPDPFRRDMLDRTVLVQYSQIVSIEPLPVPQATGSA